MILFHRGLKEPTYTASPHADGGWMVMEGPRAIAYTESEAYARAMAQALNLQRVLVTCNVRVGRPPRAPGCN